MTQKAQNIVSLFQELTLAELWTVVNAALARIHAQTEDVEIPKDISLQVQKDSELFRKGKLESWSVDDVINDIKSSL